MREQLHITDIVTLARWPGSSDREVGQAEQYKSQGQVGAVLW